jgi:chitin synthase
LKVTNNRYASSKAIPPYNTLFENTGEAIGGIDVSLAFTSPQAAACSNPLVTKHAFASTTSFCEPDCLDLDKLAALNFLPFNSTKQIGASGPDRPLVPEPAYRWSEIKGRSLVVYHYTVLNFDSYLYQHPSPIANDPVDAFIRKSTTIQDATVEISKNKDLTPEIIDCMVNKYYAGVLDQQPALCLASQLFTIILVLIIGGIMFARFAMALFFSYFGSEKVARTPTNIQNPYAHSRPAKSFYHGLESSSPNDTRIGTDFSVAFRNKSPAARMPAGTESDLFTVLLVTCYSEGELSIRTTLNSLASTVYDDTKKLLFVVADGLVKGAGNETSTPEMLLNMMQHDTYFGTSPIPVSYIAVASGSKQHNMAQVYCGSYNINGRAVPMVVVVKCGTPDESTSAKPGNRGKRDSQLILMNFFSRVILNDRMTPLDFGTLI